MKFLFSILLFSVLLFTTNNEGHNDHRYLNEARFEYSLSEDQTTLTFYDPQWKQMYRVEGLAELPSRINTQGVLWFEEGYLSIRQKADSYLSFTTSKSETPPGTSYRVKGISKFSGPDLDKHVKRVHSKKDLTLSDIELEVNCHCIADEMILEIEECESGGTGALGCGNGRNGNSCEVECREGFTACCKL